MKQTIEIEVPDGKKVVWKDNKVVFEDIEPQLPKTWEEFCKKYPINSGEFIIGTSSQIASPRLRDRDAYMNQNVLVNFEVAEQHLALMKLHQLRDCYRQGWVPDWEDDSYKYCVIQRISNKSKKYSVGWYFNIPCFLSFPTLKLAEEFLTNFRELIEQAGDLI